MVVGFFQKPLAAKVIGIDPASGLDVFNRRAGECSLGHVGLELKHSPLAAALYPSGKTTLRSRPSSRGKSMNWSEREMDTKHGVIVLTQERKVFHFPKNRSSPGNLKL